MRGKRHVGSYVTIDKQVSRAILLQANLSSTIPALKTRDLENTLKKKRVEEGEMEDIKRALCAQSRGDIA